MNRRVRSPRRAERGAALLVALVLVLVGTLLGISVLESSGTETRLLTNDAARQRTFRAAESASERALLAVDAGTLTPGTVLPVTVDSVDVQITVEATARLEGVGHLLGSSIGMFQNRLYGIEATASVEDLGARRTISQGAARRAPVTRY